MTESALLTVLIGGVILIAATLIGALIVNATESRRGTDHLERVKWVVVTASVPLLGFIVWLLFRGSRDPRNRTKMD